MRAEGSPIGREDANWPRTKAYILARIDQLRDALEAPQDELSSADARARIFEWRRFLIVVEPPVLEEEDNTDVSPEMRYFDAADQDPYG